MLQESGKKQEVELSQEESNRLLVLAQCAPVITGIKASNMITIPKSFKRQLGKLFSQSDITCFCLYEDDSRCVILLYRERQLERYIEKKEVSIFLETYGYGKMPMPEHLHQLRRRFSSFYRGEEEFPHELGAFLEYPVGDILGFIKNKGRNSILSGYWKVYQNPEKARRTFRQYDKARSEVLKKAKSGQFGRVGMM